MRGVSRAHNDAGEAHTTSGNDKPCRSPPSGERSIAEESEGVETACVHSRRFDQLNCLTVIGS